MALYDVAVQPAVHQHGAFHIYLVAYLQQSQVGAVECFLHGGDSVVGTVDAHDGEAYTIVGYALVNAQFVDKRTGERKVDIVSVLTNSYYGSKFFNNA